MKTFPLLLCLTVSLVASSLMAAPFDAGFKARGMHTPYSPGNSYRSYRSYSYAAPASGGRQSFSYAPGSDAANGYRSYSYGGGGGCSCR
jgi:hypothetical protein